MLNSMTGVQHFNDPPLARRLALGTAQMGMPYGATNRYSLPTEVEAGALLERASRGGVTWLDTAPAYGHAEATLGRLLDRFPSFRIMTKIGALGDVSPGKAADAIRASLSRSLERLRRDRVDLLLLHHALDLRRVDAADVAGALAAVKADGLAGRVGVSVYDPDDLDAVFAGASIDVVQAPLNPLDRRFASDGLRRRLAENGVALHARSLFLQGLLVAPLAELPDFAKRHPAMAAWRNWLAANEVSPIAACLHFALAHPQVEIAIVGAATEAQLAEILEAATVPAALPDLSGAPIDADLIDPRRWPFRLSS